MLAVDEQTLRDIAPRFEGNHASSQASIIGAIGSILRPTLESFDISSPLRIAHFLAQTCEESDGYCTTVEYLSGEEYNGRTDLGNTHAGDGPRYKGRGLLQLTGRVHYAEYGRLLGKDFVNNPGLAADPKISLFVACEYWKQRDLNGYADQDDIAAITHKINGGYNGLAQRRFYLARAKAVLARPILRALGFPVATDGDFVATTKLAVMRFQAAHRLAQDGILGPRTWDALSAATPPSNGPIVANAAA